MGRWQPMPSNCRCLMIGYNLMELDGLRRLLEPEFEVLAVAPEKQAALDAARRFRPDTAVIDLRPEGVGLEMARNLRETCPELALTYITGDADTYLRVTPVSRTQLIS